MLKSAGLYNRQILSVAIAGTADRQLREKLNAVPGAWVETSLPHYDAAQKAGARGGPGGGLGTPDFTEGTLIVRVHAALDDAAFLEIVKAAGIAVKTDAFDTPDKR